mmetsp:Transcript_38573/g.109089  ORF Transcript_38573/g.109089 Transcript_38573/m.109089 type:complete len:83 (+) Transcript_38573:1123-1371(+)
MQRLLASEKQLPVTEWAVLRQEQLSTTFFTGAPAEREKQAESEAQHAGSTVLSTAPASQLDSARQPSVRFWLDTAGSWPRLA